MKRQIIRRAMVIISFLFFPITLYYFSPALIIQGMAEGIITGSFILFSLLFIVSLLLGRLFCGWICPAGGLQEICTRVVNKKAKGGKYNWIKYFIWFPWITSIIVLFMISRSPKVIDGLYLTYYGISVIEPVAYVVYYGVVGLILAMAFLGGKRAFCNYVCWMAPFMIIGTKISQILRLPSLRLLSNKEKCISCSLCNKSCEMSLDVKEMVHRESMINSECILCGECVDACPKDAIGFTFKYALKYKPKDRQQNM